MFTPSKTTHGNSCLPPEFYHQFFAKHPGKSRFRKTQKEIEVENEKARKFASALQNYAPRPDQYQAMRAAQMNCIGGLGGGLQ